MTLSRQERLGLILQHADNPAHRGTLPDADIVAGGGGGECGETIRLYLKVDADYAITAARFEAEGTTLGRAAASFTIDTILGRTLPEVLMLSPNVIIEALGRDIVGDRLRSTTVTLDALKAAARGYLSKQAYPLTV